MKKSLPFVVLAALWAMSGIAPAFAQQAFRAQGVMRGNADSLGALFDGVGIIYGLDPRLLAAIARVESDYRPDAVSSAGAAGLMQLMPATAADYGVRDVFNPAQNAIGAARFLNHWSHSKLGASDSVGSLPEMLAAYNAGPAAVQRFGGMPPYCETRAYVRRVLWLYLTGYEPEGAAQAACAAVREHGRAVRERGRAVRKARPDRDEAMLERLARIRGARARASSPTGE